MADILVARYLRSAVKVLCVDHGGFDRLVHSGNGGLDLVLHFGRPSVFLFPRLLSDVSHGSDKPGEIQNRHSSHVEIQL